MPCKMTLFFNQFQSGFSETFYHPNDDPQSLANQTLQPVYQAAAKFRHISVILKAVRFNRVDGTPQSLLVRPYPKAQGTRFDAADIGPDVVSTTAVFRLSSSSGVDRRIWLRGLADYDIGRDGFGNDVPSSSLEKQTANYFGLLANAGFSIRFIKRPPTDGLTWRTVIQVNHLFTSDPNRAHFTLSNELPQLAVGNYYSFKGIGTSLPKFPREAQIISKTLLDGLTNYMIAYQLPGGVTVIPRHLRLTDKNPGYATIFNYEFERFSEHKTGRPFGSLRGRSRGVSLSR